MPAAISSTAAFLFALARWLEMAHGRFQLSQRAVLQEKHVDSDGQQLVVISVGGCQDDTAGTWGLLFDVFEQCQRLRLWHIAVYHHGIDGFVLKQVITRQRPGSVKHMDTGQGCQHAAQCVVRDAWLRNKNSRSFFLMIQDTRLVYDLSVFSGTKFH